MTQDLTFRLAKSSDFDEIQKLSEGIYNGGDYLPARFHKWMKMENLDVMLAFSGDKLVSLVVCSVVDEGMTFVSRAERTLPEFRGRGILTQLLQAMLAFEQEKYPSARRRRFVRLNNRVPGAHCKTLAQREVLSCYVEKKTIRSQQPSNLNSTEIQSRSKDYLCDVFFPSLVAQKLFPGNVILVERFPIEPLRSNIDYLMQENGDSVFFAVEKCSDDALPRSVSFGVLSRRAKFTQWSASIYSSDPFLYQAHLVYHFKRAFEVIKGDFMFSSCHDQKMTNCGKRILKEHLMQITLDEEITHVSANLYEEILPVPNSNN